MRRIESLKERRDLKIAIRRARNAIKKKVQLENDIDLNRIKKDNVRTELHRNLKKSFLKKSLRRASETPCLHSENQWYTFKNPNCYNQLDEVIVEGKRKSKTVQNLNSRLVKKDNWWNKPIDVSFKNPWPEARWDWFEDRVSGNPVWGDGSGSKEFGNRIGKNSVVGESYDMTDWAIPAGGGGNLKFWAHLDNWAKYGIKAIQTVNGGADHADKLANIYRQSYPPSVKNDTVVTTMAFNVDTIYLDTKTFSTSERKVKFSGSKDEVLKSLDSLERKNQKERWYLTNWFKD